MKRISDEKIIKLAQMCREGQTIKYIQTHTGIKGVYNMARVLRGLGADIPLPKNKVNKKRNWEGLVSEINKF